jgi:hypothetical protein
MYLLEQQQVQGSLLSLASTLWQPWLDLIPVMSAMTAISGIQ